jgi:hypothetical protein
MSSKESKEPVSCPPVSEDGDSCGSSQEEDEMMDDLEGVDIGALLEQMFMEPKKNRNMVEVLCEIKRNLEVHNKLMAKLVQVVETKCGA